jgi:hypothetical protein
MACVTPALAEEWTATLPLATVQFDGRSGNKTIYFRTTSGTWGPAGCPNAQFVMVRDVEGLKEILSIGLAAKLAGSNVRFQGTCYDSEYFSAFYIVVE